MTDKSLKSMSEIRKADARNRIKQLVELAAWFDNPKKSPYCPTPFGSTPKVLLTIANELKLHIQGK